jgi:adenosylcobinamide-GDP ribazoletransferase
MLAHLILAIRFLTIVPVPGREASGPVALGRAAWWFPVIGLALGVSLAGADRLFSFVFPALLAELLLISLWKILTGGIHLDGLADAIDGIAGPDAQHRIAIMRDSRIGVFGAVGLILCLLMSAGALDGVPPARHALVLLMVPVIGRLAPLLIGPLFPSATPGEGAGAVFQAGLSPWAAPVHLAWLWGLAGVLLGPWSGLWLSLALASVLLWAGFLASRFGGLTGDALGSSVEIGELAALAAAAGLMHVHVL